jgi:hypothetical protein
MGAEQPGKDAQRATVYEIAPPRLRIAEPARDPLSEADLSLIWQGQRFPPEALQTVDGRAVEVVNPGRRGGAAGPDYLDAVVRLDGVERRGDVELHVRASAFRGHGHDRDPAYTGLALHVVYEADEAETRLQDGALAPVAAFAPWLRGRSQELQSWLSAPEIWQQPCREAVGRLGEEAVRAALEEAGARRFEARVARMAADAARDGGEEALWRALLDALGAGGDREGFRRLAVAFPAALATSARDLEAALAYVAGLAPAPEAGVAVPGPLRPPIAATGRPANRPQVRLAGLAAVLRRSAGQRLDEIALASVSQAVDVKRLVAAWSAAPQVGAGRAQELLVNAVLPYAASRGLWEEALRLMRRLPAAPAYGKTAFLESNLRPAKGRIARNALQSQGLLGYVAEWCSRDGCGRCPLSRADGGLTDNT